MAPKKARNTRTGKKTTRAASSEVQETLPEIQALDEDEILEQRPSKRSKKQKQASTPPAAEEPAIQEPPTSEAPTREAPDDDSGPFEWPESPLHELPVQIMPPPPQLPGSSDIPASKEQTPAPQLAIRPPLTSALDRVRASETPALDRDRSITPGGSKAPRVKWTTVAETVLLEALEAIVKRGKTSDGFKRDHWGEVATKVMRVYGGRGIINWEKAKSKYEDKYRPLWGRWQEHLNNGLSGWQDNEEGLPQNSEEVMDRYFTAHPQFANFRYKLPAGYRYLLEILGDQVATGEFAHGADAESSEEASESEVGEVDDEQLQQSIERSRSASAATSASRSSSVASELGKTKEKEKSTGAKGFRRLMADKRAATEKEVVAKRKREREKKSDQLMRGVREFEGESAEMMKAIMEEYRTASQGPIPRAIALVEAELVDQYLPEDVFRIYDLLQDEAKSHALLAMDPSRRAGWIVYELGKQMQGSWT